MLFLPFITLHSAPSNVIAVCRSTSNLPQYPGEIPQFQLFTTSQYGGPISSDILVTDIDPTAGSVSFTVPSVPPGEYFIVGE